MKKFIFGCVLMLCGIIGGTGWLIASAIAKNGYSDLVVMSGELYDKFARMNRIGQAIFESEREGQYLFLLKL